MTYMKIESQQYFSLPNLINEQDLKRSSFHSISLKVRNTRPLSNSALHERQERLSRNGLSGRIFTCLHCLHVELTALRCCRLGVSEAFEHEELPTYSG
jgi:hypothetical protein